MKVKIYSLPDCIYCKQAKSYFKANNIEYEDINVEDNPEAQKEMEEISEQRSVPVIVIDGKVTVGFDESKLKDLINLQSAGIISPSSNTTKSPGTI